MNRKHAQPPTIPMQQRQCVQTYIYRDATLLSEECAGVMASISGATRVVGCCLAALSQAVSATVPVRQPPTHIGTTAIIHAAMDTLCHPWSTPEDITSVGSDRLRQPPRPHLHY